MQKSISWMFFLFSLRQTDTHTHTDHRHNHLLFIQWKDNKGVNVIFLLGNYGVTTVTRRIGSEERTVQCEKNIKKYIDKMNGLDLVDYHAKNGVGLTQIGHYKNHTVMDFMIHQGHVVWNMSCTNRDLRQRELSTWEFHAVLAEELISFVNETHQNRARETVNANALDLVMGGH